MHVTNQYIGDLKSLVVKFDGFDILKKDLTE